MLETKVVLIEYSETDKRVFVRGVWSTDEFEMLPPLKQGNIQNAIKVFENMDMGAHVGISGLVPSVPPPNRD